MLYNKKILNFSVSLVVMSITFLTNRFLPPAVYAATETQETAMGQCQVLVNRDNNRWTNPINTNFEQCAASVVQDGEYNREGWGSGFWAGNYVSVNRSGDVYYKAQLDGDWQFWGTLSSNQDPDGDGIVPPRDQCPSKAETQNNFADQDGCPDSVNGLVALAQQDINQFWAETFAAKALQYDTPRFVTFTDRTARQVHTACGKASDSPAFFCSRDNGIYLNLNFLNRLMTQIGDYAPVVVIAHEWGHYIQHQTGVADNAQFTIQTELGADCLAGAYTDYAEAANQRLEKGDIEEGVQNTYNAGDDSPWFAPGAHGSPEQRVDAFADGYQNGIETCWLY